MPLFNALPGKTDKTTADSDASLIRSSLRGDQKAFRQLMERYLPVVFNHLYRMTQNYELSEEMTQEAFVKAYSHLSGFDAERPFKPWILRIASNAAITALRRPANNVLSLSALEESSGFDPESTHAGDDPADALESLEGTEAVFNAVSALDEKYRAPLLLRYQSDLSYEEVADALDMPLNTVRTRLKRGLEKLRLQLQKHVQPSVAGQPVRPASETESQKGGAR